MTTERDFKPELSATNNLRLALSLSQWVVLYCSQEYIENDYPTFETTAANTLSEVCSEYMYCIQTYFSWLSL